jgi:outer membrane protein OmpA-like peptidoglycan-associated protein
VVRVLGQEASPQVTDEDGRFLTYLLTEGDVLLEVSHPDYARAECSAAVPSEVDCLLVPTAVDGRLEIVTVDRVGDPLGEVTVRVRGPTEHALLSDAGGIARVAEIPPGAYTAYVDDERYLIAVRPFDIVAREETSVQIRILPRPTRPRVVVKKGEISLRRQVSFATGSDEILPNSEPLLLEVADALLRNPDIARVEVQGHTDNRGGPAVNMKLSQQRAESVVRWLVQHGVASERLTAKGYGSTRPVAPNITAYNRARNRRVQFKIDERASAAGEPR